MKKKFKLGVIGAGFMATAIIKGVLKSNLLDAESIIVSDLSTDSLEKIAKLGVTTTCSNESLANDSEFILFAVKPQNSSNVFNEIKNCSCDKFISIMAGVKIDKISTALGKKMVARCMPNTPCSLGVGAIGLDCSRFTDKNDVEFIKSLLSSVGMVVEVMESKLNAVTGVSGSSPAYFYLFLKYIIESGVKNGLTESEAKKLATASMLGSAKMVLENNDKSLDELINAVCSKGGTTIQAVNCFNENKLDKIVDESINACIKRAEELEGL